MLETFKKNDIFIAKEFFTFTEEMLNIGDQEVMDAFATEFLECAINNVPDVIPLEKFVQLLGPESKAYCKAWNDFCGIQMEGI